MAADGDVKGLSISISAMSVRASGPAAGGDGAPLLDAGCDTRDPPRHRRRGITAPVVIVRSGVEAMDHLNAASPTLSDNEEMESQSLSAATLEAALLDSQAFELETELENELESIDHDCPHLVSALSIQTNKVSMLKKYKSAVVWAARNSSSGTRPKKRRKVLVNAFGALLHAVLTMLLL